MMACDRDSARAQLTRSSNPYQLAVTQHELAGATEYRCKSRCAAEPNKTPGISCCETLPAGEGTGCEHHRAELVPWSCAWAPPAPPNDRRSARGVSGQQHFDVRVLREHGR